MKRFLIAVVLVLPAGCLAQTEPGAGVKNTCGAAELVGLVGQPGSILQTTKFAGPVRILEPDQPMTMDFNPERLNIQKDRAGNIARVWCG